MKPLIVLMVICFWILLVGAIPQMNWYYYVFECLGSFSSIWVCFTAWDKLTDLAK